MDQQNNSRPDQHAKTTTLILGSDESFRSKVLEVIAPLEMEVIGALVGLEKAAIDRITSPIDMILVDGLLFPQVADEVEKLQAAEDSLVIVLMPDNETVEHSLTDGEGKFWLMVRQLPQTVPLILPQLDLIRELHQKENSAQLRLKNAVLDHLDWGIFLVNIHGKITWVNSHFSEMTGLAKDSIIGQTAGFIYRNPQNNPLIDRLWRNAFSGKGWRDKVDFFAADGSQKVHQLEIIPLRNDSGELDYFLACVQDTSESSGSVPVQPVDEAFYRHIVEQSPVLVAAFHNKNLIYINQAGAHILGFSSPAELQGHHWREFFPLEAVEQFQSEARQTKFEGGNNSLNLEIPAQCKDGSQLFLSLTFLQLPLSRMDMFHVIGQDITKRIHAQESLHNQAALSQVELAINKTTELDTVLDQINDSAAKALAVGVGSVILLLDAEKNTFISRSSNIKEIDENTPLELSLDQAQVFRWIVQHKQPLVIPDFENSPYSACNLVEEFGAHSGVGMPILVDDGLVGILLVMDDQTHEFDVGDVEYVTALANRAALAIAKEKFYQSLQAAKNAAEEAAQNRAEYLASMSHELRAPLAAINNLSELMTGTELSAVQADYLSLIKSSTERLLALMNDILDFSRLEALKLGLVEKQFNLIQLVENALDLAAIPAAQKGLDLAYRIDDDVPEILLGDANRLAQILTNLLTNAIKFTESGDIYVEIRLRADKIALVSMVDSEVEIQFSVQDTGIGIPAEQQKNLFMPFSQVNLPRKPNQPGSGLGLAICKQLVQLMNGDIWVSSKGESGKGSIFTFTIRTRMVHTPTAPFLQADQPYLIDKEIVVIGQQKLSWQILIRRLEFWGMLVRSVEDPSTAAEYLMSGPDIDLVILDLNAVNPVDDDNLVKSILQRREAKPLPVLAYTHPNTLIRESWRGVTTNILRRPISLPRLYRGLVDAVQFTNAITRPRVRDSDLEILLVDDDLINVAAVKMQLERLGFKAETVSNGVEAMQILAQKEFNLVIMDMRMDAMDGHATTRAIRQTIPTDKQPLIAILTAGVTPNQLNALQSAGIDAYLEKPISIDRLLHLLELVHRKEDAGYHPLVFGSKPASQRTIVRAESGLDLRVLQDLLRLAEPTDKQPAMEILELYFQSAPKVFQKACQAADKGEVEGLKDSLHALRGTCEIFGATRLAQLCKALEQDLRDTDMDDLTERMAAIEAEFNLVTNQLQEYRIGNLG